MHRTALCSALCLGLLVSTTFAAPPPQRLPAASNNDVMAPTVTISDQAPPPPQTQLVGPEAPECQIKLASGWAPAVRTQTLEACADELDKVAPKEARKMTTAYWNNLYLSADDKLIYKADAKSDWSQLRVRKAR